MNKGKVEFFIIDKVTGEVYEDAVIAAIKPYGIETENLEVRLHLVGRDRISPNELRARDIRKSKDDERRISTPHPVFNDFRGFDIGGPYNKVRLDLPYLPSHFYRHWEKVKSHLEPRTNVVLNSCSSAHFEPVRTIREMGIICGCSTSTAHRFLKEMADRNLILKLYRGALINQGGPLYLANPYYTHNGDEASTFVLNLFRPGLIKEIPDEQ